jgi:hypothetical protein
VEIDGAAGGLTIGPSRSGSIAPTSLTRARDHNERGER